tara:strand:+ start:1258 stop:1641 length:384 start_codon:yes stop_codon:yes gene_type:complete
LSSLWYIDKEGEERILYAPNPKEGTIMNMRFRIAYTVDLDDVFFEISRLVEEAAEGVSSTEAKLRDVSDSLQAQEVFAEMEMIKIDHVRQSLAKIDVRLEESQAMLAGLTDNVEPDSQETTDKKKKK